MENSIFVSSFNSSFSDEANERRNKILSAKLLRLRHSIADAIFKGKKGFRIEDDSGNLKEDLEKLKEEFEILFTIKDSLDWVDKNKEMPKGFWGNFGLYGVAKQDWREEELKRE